MSSNFDLTWPHLQVDLVGAANEANKDLIVEETDKYVVVFDPLDGSSNVDAGIPTGTIIGVYEHDDNCLMEGESDADQTNSCLANCLQPGTNLVAAAYCLYSSSTFLVLPLGVHLSNPLLQLLCILLCTLWTLCLSKARLQVGILLVSKEVGNGVA